MTAGRHSRVERAQTHRAQAEENRRAAQVLQITIPRATRSPLLFSIITANANHTLEQNRREDLSIKTRGRYSCVCVNSREKSQAPDHAPRPHKRHGQFYSRSASDRQLMVTAHRPPTRHAPRASRLTRLSANSRRRQRRRRRVGASRERCNVREAGRRTQQKKHAPPASAHVFFVVSSTRICLVNILSAH